MPSSEHALDRALRRGQRLLATFGIEVRDARLTSALSQKAVGRTVRMSHAKVSRIEAGLSQRLALVDAVLLAHAVGLDLSAKTYPGRSQTREAAHARRLQSFLAHVGQPLRHRTEVLLPARDGIPERRAWMP
ncbi:MAG: helix-turn-helix domain-containing protein [Candidatus Limnocylindrales bacterium]